MNSMRNMKIKLYPLISMLRNWNCWKIMTMIFTATKMMMKVRHMMSRLIRIPDWRLWFFHIYFFLHCRAPLQLCRKFRKTTTGSQHRGGEQNQKHKTTPEPTNQTQTKTQTTKQTPKKSSKLPLSEPLRCSPQRNSLPIQLPCISHTSRSISEKVASSGSGLVPSFDLSFEPFHLHFISNSIQHL